MLKQAAKDIFYYVKQNEDKNITSSDIAAALGIGRQSVDGTITAAFTRKKLMVRVPATIDFEDGTTKEVKFIKMTPEGLIFDPEEEQCTFK